MQQASERFQECIGTLESAVRRYPDAPNAYRSRYMIAEAYRHQATLPLKQLEVEQIETTRIDLYRDAMDRLKSALTVYTSLQEEMALKQDQNHLGELEERVLRNSYFAQGHVLFDLGQYREAIEAFSAATNRYPRDPASLEAYVRIAACYRRLNDPAKARGTIEQALVVLQQIPEDADFSTTRFKDREQWPEMLKWLQTL